MYERNFVKVPYNKDLSLDINNIIAHLSHKTQLLILLNPNNPMGNVYTDEEFEEQRKKYTYCQPFTKESLLYREIFEEFYPGQAEMIKDFWMPNKEWEGCDVNDPSARVLSNYGASGV